MPRYVPKTYNNRRVLRIILGTVITIALSTVILFLILFFIFSRYVGEGGRLILPWDPEFQETVVEEPREEPVEDDLPIEGDTPDLPEIDDEPFND